LAAQDAAVGQAEDLAGDIGHPGRPHPSPSDLIARTEITSGRRGANPTPAFAETLRAPRIGGSKSGVESRRFRPPVARGGSARKFFARAGAFMAGRVGDSAISMARRL